MSVTRIQVAQYRRLVRAIDVLRGGRGVQPDAVFQELLEQIAAGAVLLADELERARDLLRQHQWSTDVNGVYRRGCPECLRTSHEGHAPNCAIALFLGD